MLAVMVADVGVRGKYQFEPSEFGSNPEHLRFLAEWLIEHEVEEVVMESTGQYWKPIWGALERYWKPGCKSEKVRGRCRDHYSLLVHLGAGSRASSATYFQLVAAICSNVARLTMQVVIPL